MTKLEEITRAAYAHAMTGSRATWETARPTERQAWLGIVRAAVEKLRVPTDKMCFVAGNGNATRGNGDWYVDGPADVWRTMVDELLKEET
jgi:hypothetical protein